MSTNSKGALRGSAPKEVPDESDSSVTRRLEASADSRRAVLLEEAATLISKSIYSAGHGFTSPAVRTIEQALSLIFQDAAEYHRYLSESPRNVRELVFKRRAA